MCILCAIQKWSRRVATMLPWLVIPLIGLWALSQLLPPAFRFEITSPRLACVFVLLVTLFWYEVLMPQLSAWRVRRNARLRERKRFEAIELQKLRKTATRKCRNCLTPYKDQNPGGGRFMCSYCGHISKRPVLDLPVPPGMGITNSGIIKDLVGKGGKILNGKAWSESGWICGQDWLDNGSWVSGKPTYWRKNGSGTFGGDENCLAEKSYSGVAIFASKLPTSFFLSIWWLWRKIFRVGSSRDNGLSDADHRGMFSKRGDNGANCHESRGEKARRKAEEKRQARLEKELLEEEERKQREEVARLVEERRKLRDEKMGAENDRGKSSPPIRDKEGRKEAEKRRQEKRKDKNKASSKSNSDAEEMEKRAGKETERKREFDKKVEIDRQENQKLGTDTVKNHCMEVGHGQGIKNTPANSFNRGSAGNRYLDRMKGTFLSSSKAFTEGGFFGKSPSATIVRETKANGSVDHFHNLHRRDNSPAESLTGRLSSNADDKNSNTNRPVFSESYQTATPKKSWHQLFTRSAAVPASSNGNVISRPNNKLQTEGQSKQIPGHPSSMQMFDNPISFGLPSPFVSTYSNTVPTTSTSLGYSAVSEPIFHQAVEVPQFIPEEQELFEDPCYVPEPYLNPESLLGPVSESLYEFESGYGCGVGTDMGLEKTRALRNISTSCEISRPSPIESPLSRSRVTDEKHNCTTRVPGKPKPQDFNVDNGNANEKGTWQMWNGPSLGQDSLGLVGGPSSWLLQSERNILNKEDFMHPSTQKTMASLFTDEDPTIAGAHSPHKVFIGASQNGGSFSPVTYSSNQDLWAQKALFPSLSGRENHVYLMPQEEKGEAAYVSPRGASNSHAFEPSSVNGWSKKGRAGQSGEGVGKWYGGKPPVVGLFPKSDVQSVWPID